MGQYLQQFDYTGYQFFNFQLDEDNYNKVKQISLVDFTIQFESSDIIRGAIQTFEHTSIDSNCWNDVTFSVDRDWAFNISVVPVGCQISKSVLVSLEYFNASWMSIPIIPTTPTGAFAGYKTGDFDARNVFFFNSSSEGDTVNAELIINFVELFKVNFTIPLRLKVIENFGQIQNEFTADIQTLGNELSVQSSPQTNCTLDTWYSYLVLYNTQQWLGVLNAIPNGYKIYSQQHIYDAANETDILSSFQLELTKFQNRQGILYYHHKTVELNDYQSYSYNSFLQLQDINGKMLAALYFSGFAYVPCFTSREQQWSSTQVCFNFFLHDTNTCRYRYLENGITGVFVGEATNPDAPLDPTQRKTYFYMSITQPITESWFGNYNSICTDERNGTGNFQGENMTYGTFKQRLYDFGKYIQLQKTNLSMNCWIKTSSELEFITNWRNEMTFDAFKWVWIVMTGVIAVVGACVVFAIRSLKTLN
ncbi:Conserved_hypothetical protein [Hexamita inflata]|uniref:Transmembrane protein n=1 Tax=Hexamita inflata TaxID=28002 RepID=A0AA86NCT6_9EUKA|nr:Conserved hypothetical protein [Hexamita inflata]CAI9975712.1 Conserved hypothetical protein [Hexamita inflata]